MYKGAEIRTKERLQYFNAECMILPTEGSGFISSMFSFYDGTDFKTNWEELDIECLGKNTNQFDLNFLKTINYYVNKTINIKPVLLNDRGSAKFWKIGIESTPTGVTWKLNDIIVNTSSVSLKLAHRIIFNIWASNDKQWAGEVHPDMFPRQMQVSYFRLSKWNNGKFEFMYQDEFDGNALDATRWDYGTHTLDSTQLVKENVIVKDGLLTLKLTK
jgi:beta-glucanase (GH16 family)